MEERALSLQEKKKSLIWFEYGIFVKKIQVKINTLRTGTAGVLNQRLERRQRKNGDLLLAWVDEFQTSKVIRKHLCLWL